MNTKMKLRFMLFTVRMLMIVLRNITIKQDKEAKHLLEIGELLEGQLDEDLDRELT